MQRFVVLFAAVLPVSASCSESHTPDAGPPRFCVADTACAPTERCSSSSRVDGGRICVDSASASDAGNACPPSRPRDGDPCMPPPAGYECRYNLMTAGACSGTTDDCSCLASGWGCTTRSHDDYLVPDGGRLPITCGTGPMCLSTCVYPPEADAGAGPDALCRYVDGMCTISDPVTSCTVFDAREIDVDHSCLAATPMIIACEPGMVAGVDGSRCVLWRQPDGSQRAFLTRYTWPDFARDPDFGPCPASLAGAPMFPICAP